MQGERERKSEAASFRCDSHGSLCVTVARSRVSLVLLCERQPAARASTSTGLRIAQEDVCWRAEAKGRRTLHRAGPLLVRTAHQACPAGGTSVRQRVDKVRRRRGNSAPLTLALPRHKQASKSCDAFRLHFQAIARPSLSLLSLPLRHDRTELGHFTRLACWDS